MAGYPKECTVCGKDYRAPNNKKDLSFFCSKACKNKSMERPILIEQETEVVSLYESGLTWKEVGEKLGLTKSQMGRIIKQIKSKIDFKSRVGKKLNQTGENNDSWKGGRIKMSGYITVKAPGHPRGMGGNRGYVMEHILVMEAYINRYLVFARSRHPENEIVHHINGIRDDNRIENLVLMTAREHSQLHSNQKWAKEIVDTTNNITYPSFEAACEASRLNENELATYIHFHWKHKGIHWTYAAIKPITGRFIEV